MKQFKRATLFLLALSFSLGIFWACKRTLKNDDVLGNPAMKSAPTDFAGINNAAGIVTKYGSYTNELGFPIDIVPGEEVQFAGSRYVYFDNSFSHEVSWFLTLTGSLSGAVKKFSGTGSKLTMNEFVWDGGSDGVPFFMRDDSVHYSLTFLGSTISYAGALHIQDRASAVPYSGSRYIYNINGDTLQQYYFIDNFDGSPGIQTSYSDAADGNGKAVFYVVDKQGVDDKSVDGHLSYYMKGTDNNGNNYCGGASGEALAELNGWSKETDPGKVFINAYVYGYANRHGSSILFQLYENDFAENPVSGPSSYPVRDKTKNDMWYTIVQVNWVGWKLVSVPYSSFKPANDPMSGGNGNRIQEPHKLAGFGIELESYPTPGLTAEIGLDQVSLTTNKAFQP